MSVARTASVLVLALVGVAGAQEPEQSEGPLPTDAVARVDDRVIDRSKYRHWREIAQRSGGGETRETEVRRDVMSFLISGVWIELEAKRRGIHVTRRQVRREFRQQRREAFSSRREYRRFLRATGQTATDLRYRVKLDLLSRKVRKDVVGDVEGARRQQRRLDRFVIRFRERWRSRTICARGYRVTECGSVA